MTVTGDGFPSAPRSADGGDDQVNGFAAGDRHDNGSGPANAFGGTFDADDGAGWTSDDEAPPASRAAGYAPAATWIDEDDDPPASPSHGGTTGHESDDEDAVVEEYVAVERGD